MDIEAATSVNNMARKPANYDVACDVGNKNNSRVLKDREVAATASSHGNNVANGVSVKDVARSAGNLAEVNNSLLDDPVAANDSVIRNVKDFGYKNGVARNIRAAADFGTGFLESDNCRDYHVTDIDGELVSQQTSLNYPDSFACPPSPRPRCESLTLAPAKSLMMNNAEQSATHPPTSYFQSIVHLFKGNIGPGLFAMGDAFKNGGLVIAPLLTIAIALISIHCQHILINCSNRMRVINKLDYNADYAETVEQCFENGPPKLSPWSKTMRVVVNVFICVTQLGFCCIYFVFISSNVLKILSGCGIHIDVHLIMLMAFVPILLSSLITNLKLLTPVSLVANLCMIFGLAVTLYYALHDGLPDISQHYLYTNPPQMALFFGTAIFAFEGIALVLPLKNAMGNPEDFERPLGVLNVGMFCVSCMFMFAGFVGYMKWGEKVSGSLTLNLGTSLLAQCVMALVSMGVMLGYPLQFFIAIQIMWPTVKRRLGFESRPFTGELLFRTAMVLCTLGIAELVPALSLFISLIGSLCSTALALVFPPLIELLIKRDNGQSPGVFLYVKNFAIVGLALLGFSTGTYESLSQIIKHFGETDL